MLKSDGWFSRTFPTLANYPADKWMMIPLAFFLTLAMIIGVVDAIYWPPPDSYNPCKPCNDVQMMAYDEYLCTGKVGNTGSFEKNLAACRKKLGKPAVY